MTERNISTGNIIKNLIWKFMERMSVQFVNLLVQIILARLLVPEDFAIVAIITVFINFANIFVQSGFGIALIQKERIDDVDSSTVFFFSIFVALALTGVIFVAAPVVESFYSQEYLATYLRTQSIVLIFSSFNTVQQAILARNMQFKHNFKAGLIACIISGTCGIICAFLELGVWALVVLNVVNSFVLSVVLWFSVKWRPVLAFSLNKLVVLYSFSWKIMCSSFLEVVYVNIRTLLIGKVFDPQILGYYNRADILSASLMNGITGAISAIMLPVLSAKQNQISELKSMLRKTMSLNCFIVFPVMFGLAAVSEPIIVILFTNKWIEVVPFMQLLCIAYAFYPMHAANLQAINALGRSDISLKLEVIKRITGMVLIVCSIPFGVYAIVGSSIIYSIIATLINSFPNKMLINYSFKEQLKDIYPYLIMSIVMSATVFLFGRVINFNSVIELIIQVFLGVLIYFILCKFTNIEAYSFLMKQLKKHINK